MLKEAAVDSDVQPIKRPAHERVYSTLRASILFGDLIPGQAVTLQGLSANMRAGMTPVREAVRRLTSDGALKMQGNRRVSVPELSESCIEQIEFMRLSLEVELTKRAATIVTSTEIDQLEENDSALNQAILRGDIAGYLRQNYQFHKSLYEVANVPIVAATVDRLWLRFGPSLRVVCGRFGTLNLPDRHLELLHALRRKDTHGATEALAADIRQGMTQMRAGLASKATADRFD